MKKFLFIALTACLASLSLFSQNVFSPTDPIVRYDKNQTLGTSKHPNPAKLGLQKWVSTPTVGVSTGSAAFDNTSFKAYFINVAGTRMAFRIKFPNTYSKAEGAGKKYPVMLFLHGAGEVGCSTNGGIYNNERQIWLGGSLFRDRVDNKSFDGFLVYPQLVTTSADCWGVWGTAAAANFTAVFAMIDSLAKYARANVDRVVVDGLSGGGSGAWRVASSYPQRVAKIMPSAAAGSTTNRTAFVHIPIWFATGGKDPDPSPAQAQNSLTKMKEIGADIRYTTYPTLGHNMWYNHWREPDFVAAMNDVHKANPMVYFGKKEFCTGESVNTKMGVTPGFYAYEWQKDAVTIATRTNGANTIISSSSIISFTGNEVTVKAFGSYRVRFKRFSYSAWSDWSPKPAVIKGRTAGGTGSPITVVGTRSKVLPALDGSTTVPLQLPGGYTNYDWRRVSDNVKVSSSQTYNAPAGVYKAKYDESAGCGPGYSANFTVVNANGSPKPDPANTLTVTSLSTTSLRLNWKLGANETGTEIYRGTAKGGPYQLIEIADANVLTYTDNNIVTNTPYFYVVRAVNNTGAAVKSNEGSPNGGNTPPVISAISNVTMESGTTTTRSFTVTDNAGDITTVSIQAKPAFVTLTKLSTTSYRINIAPTADNVGLTDITVLAADNKGMSTTKSFSIVVSNKDTRSVFVNLGASGKVASAPWTNWLGVRTAGSVLSNLKDESGVVTTFDITTVSGWATTTSIGHMTGNNSGIAPDAVLQSGIADNGAAKQIRFSGLSTAKRYNLVFIGSQNEGGTATTQYSTAGQNAVLNARYNTQQAANLNSLVPDASGNITVTATRTGSTLYSYLNGIIIEEYSPSVTMLNPENLYVEPIDRTSVQLTWCDKTNNESATGGYEIKRATNSTFTTGLVTLSVPGNTTSYKNTGLVANTKYWYRVRAKNGTAYSAYSNSMATITPVSIVYVNFNTSVANGPFPWNNLVASPLSPFTSAALKNQSGTVTPIKIKLEGTFNGEFTAGMTTGSNSGVAPDNVLKSNFWIDNGQIASFRATGLNKTRRYRFGFFGSSSPNGWHKGDYTATYMINGRKVYLNSWQNTSKIVYIGDILPNAAGEVFIEYGTTAAANWNFSAGMVIEEYTDTQGGTVLNSVLEEEGSPLDDLLIENTFIYPNPFNNQINISFNNKKAASNITAELYDITGRLTYRYNFSDIPEGSNTLLLRIPDGNTENGLHILSLKVNGRTVTSVKMLKQNK